MKNNRIRRILMVAAGIYLAYTGFDLTRAVIGSSEKNKWVFLAFAVLFSCVWSDGYCYECQRHDTGLQRWQEREKIRRQRGDSIANRDGI